MPYPVWINGNEGGHIHPADRGLAYGDGLFETLRVAQGRAVLLDEHLARLQQGAATLAIVLDAEALRAEFQRFLQHCPADCVAKIVLTRGVGTRGYLPDPGAVPTRILSAHALPAVPAAHAEEGIRAGLCTSLALAAQPRLAGLKHLNRLEQVLLRQELAVQGCDEALVCDAHGQVVEGVFSNVFLVHAGRLCTPRLAAAGIRGVLRTVILRAAAAAGETVLEGEFTPDDFLAADEVFFCNSVNGIWPVRSLAGRVWRPGPVTRRWQAFWRECAGAT